MICSRGQCLGMGLLLVVAQDTHEAHDPAVLRRQSHAVLVRCAPCGSFSNITPMISPSSPCLLETAAPAPSIPFHQGTAAARARSKLPAFLGFEETLQKNASRGAPCCPAPGRASGSPGRGAGQRKGGRDVHGAGVRGAGAQWQSGGSGQSALAFYRSAHLFPRL